MGNIKESKIKEKKNSTLFSLAKNQERPRQKQELAIKIDNT
jgi:hypothetical protein